MPQDPYSTLAQPTAQSDPYAAIAMAPPAGAPSSIPMRGQYLAGGEDVPASRSVGEQDDPNWKMDEYHRVKTATAVASILGLPEASIPSLLTGVAGGIAGNVAGRGIAAKAGAGEAGQEIAGDVGALGVGAATSMVGNFAVSKARALYSALPDSLQKELIGVASPRLKNALRLWDVLSDLKDREAAQGINGELDATRENKAYAGEPQPKPAPVLDATRENRAYAGEPVPKPSREVAQASALQSGSQRWSDPAASLGQIPNRYQPPAIEPAPQPSMPPGSAGSMVRSVVSSPASKSSGDPLLDKLRAIASDIEAEEKTRTTAAKSEAYSEENPEGDLIGPMLEALHKINARKGAVQ